MLHIIIAPPQFSNTNNGRVGQARMGEYNFTEMRMRGIYNYEPRPQDWEKNSQELMDNVGRKIVAKVKCPIQSFNQLWQASLVTFLNHY